MTCLSRRLGVGIRVGGRVYHQVQSFALSSDYSSTVLGIQNHTALNNNALYCNAPQVFLGCSLLNMHLMFWGNTILELQ